MLTFSTHCYLCAFCNHAWRSIELFDVYQGKGVPEGHKSLALSLTLQADDRTLSEEDITATSKAVIAAAEKLGAQLR